MHAETVTYPAGRFIHHVTTGKLGAAVHPFDWSDHYTAGHHLEYSSAPRTSTPVRFGYGFDYYPEADCTRSYTKTYREAL